jgi:hypothetical protein
MSKFGKENNLYKHGMRKTRFYGIWKGINGRCYCKTNFAYHNYGKKGITSSWRDNFLEFKKDMYESYLEHINKFGEKDTTIDRIDPTRNYCKENCRWATQLEQARNRTDTFKIVFKKKEWVVRELAEFLGIKYETLRRRILKGWKGDEIFIKTLGYGHTRQNIKFK